MKHAAGSKPLPELNPHAGTAAEIAKVEQANHHLRAWIHACSVECELSNVRWDSRCAPVAVSLLGSCEALESPGRHLNSPPNSLSPRVRRGPSRAACVITGAKAGPPGAVA